MFVRSLRGEKTFASDSFLILYCRDLKRDASRAIRAQTLFPIQNIRMLDAPSISFVKRINAFLAPFYSVDPFHRTLKKQLKQQKRATQTLTFESSQHLQKIGQELMYLTLFEESADEIGFRFLSGDCKAC